MYYSEEITPEIIQRLTKNEDTGDLYKVAGNRITIARQCIHCKSKFYPSRKDHIYCKSSCRTMACYKRKKYEYQSGRYVKKEVQNQAVKPTENLQASLSVTQNKTTGFDWQNFQSSAAATASVETLKYLLHDRVLMNKIDQIHAMLSKRNLPNQIQYLGIQMNGNQPISLFRDMQGFTLANDTSGNWYRLLSTNPTKWVVAKDPFKS